MFSILAQIILTIMSTFHSLTVKHLEKTTIDSTVITFELPEHLRSAYEFIPGQYLTLETSINDEMVRRAYSICSTPSQNTIKVAVKKIEGGKFSTYVNNTLKVSDTLQVSTPEGKFTLKTDSSNSKTYVAFAAGSGITPILSMISAVSEQEPDSQFVLMFGNKSSQNTMFYNELNTLQENNNNVSIYYSFSQSNEEGHLFGRIDASKVNYIINNKHKDANIDGYYLCGPEEMINLVSNTLKSNGVDSDIINFELFTSSTDTNTTEEQSNFNSAQVNILLDDEEHNITVSKDVTILDAALKAGLDAPYSCQGGVCSSCICKVTEGEVIMRKNLSLTDEEIEEGFVLSCQAVINSAIIAIDFDDI